MEQTKPRRNSIFSTLCIICIVLFLICIVVVCATLTNDYLDEVQAEREAARASVLAQQAEHNQRVSSFPHALELGNKTAYISAIDLLEVYAEHGYVAFVVVTIDRGDLTDDDLYWMLKGYQHEWELNATAHWWPDGTDNDIQSLNSLGCRYTDNNVYFFFRTDHLRYSANGKHFSVAITYQPDGADFSDSYRHSYSADFTGELYHASPDFLPTETYDQLLKSLDNWSAD